ncbi:hypothetical protein GALL_198610 [mine drainage metagenome]|uniref:Uncharacterized protein n=1 Tax=mine drainage metagenome TaxID=410659 RepID=A0A1J5RQX4_9ZZZZ
MVVHVMLLEQATLEIQITTIELPNVHKLRPPLPKHNVNGMLNLNSSASKQTISAAWKRSQTKPNSLMTAMPLPARYAVQQVARPLVGQIIQGCAVAVPQPPGRANQDCAVVVRQPKSMA